MKFKLVSFVLFFVLIESVKCHLFNANLQKPESGKIWAVLAAGSNTYRNYRHQANIGHVYQVLKAHGVEEENIITMMYDDVANDPENPYPGKLFSRPNGSDVYSGLKIDYKGKDVTPENFLAILLGQKDKVKGGRVLESTKEDKVFIYFTDHGFPGFVSFPHKILCANKLNETLTQMHKQEQYKELVFYLEACESGSMFKNILSKDINIYSVAAAHPDESVYACFCETDFLPNTCLTDYFTSNWLNDTETKNLHNESFQQQFDFIQKRMSGSQPMQFGDLKIVNETVSNFLGNKNVVNQQQFNGFDIDEKRCWPVKDIPLKALEAKLERAFDLNEKNSISKELNEFKMKRKYLDEHLDSFVKKLIPNPKVQRKVLINYPESITQWDCYRDSVETFNQQCFNTRKSPYASNYLRVLANLCEQKIETQLILDSMKDHCKGVKYQEIQ